MLSPPPQPSGTHTHPIFSPKPTSPYPNPTRIQFGSAFRTRSTKQSSSSSTSTTPSSSLYDLLGISPTVTFTDIKKAYKQLALKYHPDVSPPESVEEYTEKFIRVQEAYETLSDPNSRALYDRYLGRGLHWKYNHNKNNNNSIHCFHQEMEDKSRWRSRWQEQLSGLKNRSKYRDGGDNMSWGARMRQQRNGEEEGEEESCYES